MLYLAPILNVTDNAFRLVCRSYGCDVCFTEMIPIDSFCYSKLLIRSADDVPLVLQIAGDDGGLIYSKWLSVKDDFCELNINAGCPDLAIVENGYGCGLLKNLDKLYYVLKFLVDKNVNVSVKIRSGIKSHSELKGIIDVIEKSGCKKIYLHCRTMEQGYGGVADWNLLIKAKEWFSGEVIGNGDVFSVDDYSKISKLCDGVMIGRGSFGNPNLFGLIKGLHEVSQYDQYLKYLEIVSKVGSNMNYVKRHSIYFTKGMKDSAVFRNKLAKVKDLDEVKKLVKEFLSV